MSMAKTCEEYVIQELYFREILIGQRDRKIECLEEELEKANNQIQKLKEVIDSLNPSIRLSCDGTSMYVETDNIWSKYDSVKYDLIVDVLDLEEPKTEVEETSEK